METLVPSVPAVNGEPRCNSESSPSLRFLPSTCNGFASATSSRDCASEESSASTLSEESFGCAPVTNGLEPVLCNGAPPLTKSKMEKRSLKRRRSRNAEQQPEEMMNSPLPVTIMPALEELMKGKDTFGRTAVTGRV